MVLHFNQLWTMFEPGHYTILGIILLYMKQARGGNRSKVIHNIILRMAFIFNEKSHRFVLSLSLYGLQY